MQIYVNLVLNIGVKKKSTFQMGWADIMRVAYAIRLVNDYWFRPIMYNNNNNNDKGNLEVSEYY